MPTERLYIDTLTFRAGPFDSTKRYLRAGASASTFPLVRGKTVNVSLVNQGSYIIVALRYGVAGYTRTTNYSVGGTTPGSSVPVNGGSFNANYSLVTT